MRSARKSSSFTLPSEAASGEAKRRSKWASKSESPASTFSTVISPSSLPFRWPSNKRADWSSKEDWEGDWWKWNDLGSTRDGVPCDSFLGFLAACRWSPHLNPRVVYASRNRGRFVYGLKRPKSYRRAQQPNAAESNVVILIHRSLSSFSPIGSGLAFVVSFPLAGLVIRLPRGRRGRDDARPVGDPQPPHRHRLWPPPGVARGPQASAARLAEAPRRYSRPRRARFLRPAAEPAPLTPRPRSRR